MDKGATVEDAAAMCLDELNTLAHGRLRSRPAWFWFNDTPAPIAPDDSVSSLVDRWHIWREALACRSCGALSALLEWRDALRLPGER